jgi:hypothetical protein
LSLEESEQPSSDAHAIASVPSPTATRARCAI